MKFKTLLFADIKHARSSEAFVARATRHRKLSLEPRSPRSSQKLKSALERKNAHSSQQLNPTGLQPEARSSDRPLARAKNKPDRSSEEKLARAKKCNSQVQNQTQSFARAKPLWLDPPDTTQLSLEQPTPRSSEGPKIWAATLGSQTQPTCNKPAQHIL